MERGPSLANLQGRLWPALKPVETKSLLLVLVGLRQPIAVAPGPLKGPASLLPLAEPPKGSSLQLLSKRARRV